MDKFEKVEWSHKKVVLPKKKRKNNNIISWVFIMSGVFCFFANEWLHLPIFSPIGLVLAVIGLFLDKMGDTKS